MKSGVAKGLQLLPNGTVGLLRMEVRNKFAGALRNREVQLFFGGQVLSKDDMALSALQDLSDGSTVQVLPGAHVSKLQQSTGSEGSLTEDDRDLTGELGPRPLVVVPPMAPGAPGDEQPDPPPPPVAAEAPAEASDSAPPSDSEVPASEPRRGAFDGPVGGSLGRRTPPSRGEGEEQQLMQEMQLLEEQLLLQDRLQDKLLEEMQKSEVQRRVLGGAGEAPGGGEKLLEEVQEKLLEEKLPEEVQEKPLEEVQDAGVQQLLSKDDAKEVSQEVEAHLNGVGVEEQPLRVSIRALKKKLTGPLEDVQEKPPEEVQEEVQKSAEANGHGGEAGAAPGAGRGGLPNGGSDEATPIYIIYIYIYISIIIIIIIILIIIVIVIIISMLLCYYCCYCYYYYY